MQLVTKSRPNLPRKNREYEIFETIFSEKATIGKQMNKTWAGLLQVIMFYKKAVNNVDIIEVKNTNKVIYNINLWIPCSIHHRENFI